MKRRHLSLALAAGAACAVSSAADAVIQINVTQSGADVVAAMTGSLNLTGLTVLPNPFGLSTAIRPMPGYIGLGTSTLTTGYTGLTGPGTFGAGATFTTSSSNSGDGFGLDAYSLSQALFLPVNYVSGAQLSGSSTFANTSIATLGLTAGQYVFLTPGDSITINIGGAAAAVPEPGTWMLMLAGFGLVGASIRSRRQSIAAHRAS